MFILSDRDEERLKGVHHDLLRVVWRAAVMSDTEFMVLEGLRTIERQKRLLAQGATTTLKSRHLTGHAVDLAPMIDLDGDGRMDVSWAWPHYHELAKIVKAAAAHEGVPVEWGGDWKKFKDGPHWQLPWTKYP